MLYPGQPLYIRYWERTSVVLSTIPSSLRAPSLSGPRQKNFVPFSPSSQPRRYLFSESSGGRASNMRLPTWDPRSATTRRSPTSISSALGKSSFRGEISIRACTTPSWTHRPSNPRYSPSTSRRNCSHSDSRSGMEIPNSPEALPHFHAFHVHSPAYPLNWMRWMAISSSHRRPAISPPVGVKLKNKQKTSLGQGNCRRCSVKAKIPQL